MVRRAPQEGNARAPVGYPRGTTKRPSAEAQIPPHPPRRVAVGAFDRDAYEQFSLPAKLGTPIACWDDPEMVPGAEAAHMRADDYVIGLTLDGARRAYPLWVVDHYHAINDRVGGRRFVVASCERCQSGSAYLADLPVRGDREPLFRGAGVLNAVLLLKDIATGTWWNHYEGLGLRGRMAGLALPLIPTYHMEWADWLAMHPDTTVMAPPQDPAHPDARHGHGREEIFSRPGIDPTFVSTISGPLDRSYPENEMVLGVEVSGSWVAYPLREVRREAGVVNEAAGDDSVAILAGPAPDGFTMSAFRSALHGRTLTFRRERGEFVDDQTGSRWSIEGVARGGPLAGERLEPLRWFYVRWHAWVYFHRDTRLFLSRTQAPRFDPAADGEDAGGFRPLLSALAAAGHEVRVEGPVVSQRRPREALASLEVQVDGDRVNLHRFATGTAAADYEALDGAWSGHPLRPRVLPARLRRIGSLIVESDPPVRFVDPAQAVPLSPGSIEWAAVLSSPVLDELREDAAGEPGELRVDAAGEPAVAPGFRDVIRSLRSARLEVIDVGFLPPGQLRVGCVNGIGLTVEGDRFLLYRFASPDQARDYAAGEPHTVSAGVFVLRSTPEDMYVGTAAEILFAGDDRVRWSRLLDDGRVLRALRAAAGEAT
jgi:Protein of unknown function (DUF3179)